MKRCGVVGLVLLGGLFTSGVCVAQQGEASPEVYDSAPMPKEPEAVLALASKANGLAGDGLKPWYLKAHYQAYDAQGKPSVAGTYEVYWLAPHHYRESYAEEGWTTVRYTEPNGSFAAGSRERLHEAERLLPNEFLSLSFVDSPNRTKTKAEKVGAPTFRCMRAEVGDDWTRFCFEAQRPILRVLAGPIYSATFNDIRLFQHRFVAGEVEVEADGRSLLRITLDELRSMTASESVLLDPPPGAMPLPVMVGANDKPPRVIYSVPPQMPVDVPRGGRNGVVLVSIVVGTDGLVHAPEVLHSSGDAFAREALKAIAVYRFEPAKLDGKPVEVEIDVQVRFRTY